MRRVGRWWKRFMALCSLSDAYWYPGHEPSLWRRACWAWEDSADGGSSGD